MDCIPLPYFAAFQDLPHPLPTNDVIENSQEVLSEYSGRRVVRLGCYFVAKYGTGVNLIEGENMLFVSRVTDVRVPKVYAIYSDPQTKTNYIVMENTGGHTLDLLWTSLSMTQKKDISAQLRYLFNQLRSIPSPGYYGSLGQRGLLGSIFWTGNGNASIESPFETEQDLNEAMIQKYTYNNLPAEKAEFYRRYFPFVLRNHRAVFTHGDFQRKNIMIKREIGADTLHKSSAEEKFSVVIIDWESSGWYPSYWEFATAIFSCGRWGDDWHNWVGNILKPFLNEYAWMQMLRAELWS